jgi:hypothetical protein
MKTALLMLISVVSACAIFSSCSKSNGPAPLSPQAQTTRLLIGGPSLSSASVPWKMQSSSVDGIDQTALYNGFTVTFTSSGFTTTNGGVIWPASGTWNFQGTSTATVVRNDGVNVQIQVSSVSLVMTVVWTKTTLASGRTVSTSGNNVFMMSH